MSASPSISRTTQKFFNRFKCSPLPFLCLALFFHLSVCSSARVCVCECNKIKTWLKLYFSALSVWPYNMIRNRWCDFQLYPYLYRLFIFLGAFFIVHSLFTIFFCLYQHQIPMANGNCILENKLTLYASSNGV